MRCYVHSMREAIGYCIGCGNFFCDKCLSACEEGKHYCATCREKLGKKTSDQTRPRDERLATKLLIKFKKGSSLHGTTYKIDPSRSSFRITPFTAKGPGEEREIEFSHVKYVALVESFGKEKSTGPPEYQPKGSEVSVTFPDGETIKGYTLKAYSDKDARFSVIPEDPEDNRISIIVERSAVSQMSLGRIPKAQELRILVNNSVKRMILHYYWQHPDIVVTVDELANRLERTSAVVERELEDFIREGLIRRLNGEGKQLKFTPSRDPIVRQAVSNMAKDIEMLYFRKKPPTAATPTPQRPARPQHWPL